MTSASVLRFQVHTPKEYPWGSFTLWLFPEDILFLRADNEFLLTIEPKDSVARSNGQRSRRELYWRTDFFVHVPKDDIREVA